MQKKKRLLVLGGQKGLSQIKQRLKSYDIDLHCHSFSDISILIVDNEVSVFCKEIPIDVFDFVWVKASWGMREIAQSVAYYLEKKQIKHTELDYDKSKLTDMVQLALGKVRVPNMFFARNKSIDLFLNKNKISLTYPIIIKPTKGSLGRDIFFVNNKKELAETVQKLSKKKFYIIQEFLPNKFDFRIITSGEEVLSIDKRTRQDAGYLNNAFLGATEEFLNIEDVSSEVIQMSIDAARVLDLKWSGIDIIISETDNKPYIIEVNRRPGLTTNSTEMDAALSHILKLLAIP